jgi:hypothetical protein
VRGSQDSLQQLKESSAAVAVGARELLLYQAAPVTKAEELSSLWKIWPLSSS